ncbi:hypothetical protein QBA57_41625 [Streptomyces scabiei]|uniref:hypothetical protein n=1 Tax=Streptomyces scabiei TaxID=1930 RepID=UPI001B312E63|nr:MULTISPECIES: hypothetical protein [Streptomyces]MDW8478532.1 hypothetical protein [Streptomyces scabiei]MDX2571431.1 hypothetical protein [Streptomyces scabiei]MDX3151685.1 hypothetical protein [Streptomyces scabiei]MDX3159651.1 hypothetical protein [Streptomyces scabiei]MDX3170212.1 hypothetical protein [Streptomyces scabiei]
MMRARGSGATRDRDYVARVRRHRPSALLPLIARASAAYSLESSWLESPYRKYTPWALADAARVSLACGNEYRKDADDADLLKILDMYSQLEDHYLYDHDSDDDALGRFLLRTSGEQMTFQEPVFQELARAAAMLTQTAATREARCLRPGWEEELLGASLSQYVGIAQLLWASAISRAGRFDPDSLREAGAHRICAEIPAATITSVTEQHFVTDAAAFRKANTRACMTTDPLLRRFEYNPLRGTPFVRGYGPGLLAPVSHLIPAKASPLGIYYTGVARYGDAFAQDLGVLFEAYVGRQLQLLPDAVVRPEIVYGRNRARSVDWIVVTDELVLLVEVKSVRPTRHLRLATDQRVKEVNRMLGRAYGQIDNTAALIASGQKEFAGVPTDRPVHGLIVTMEPFHIVNAPLQRPQLPATTVPVTVCSISELENMVTIDDAPVGRLLREQADDSERSTYALREALLGHTHARNTVLDAGWDSYPWRHAAAGQVPSEPAGTAGV